MSVIATVAVPPDAFPLGSVLEDSDATVQMETTVPTREGVIPYLWLPDAVDSVAERLESEAAVATATVVDDVDDYLLVRLAWADDFDGVLAAIRASDALVTEATGAASGWLFQLRFPSLDQLSTFYVSCVDQDVRLELVQLHEAVGPTGDDRYGLTESQRELLVTAHEAGYFEVPRRTTLVELGDHLGISDSAVSQRLRRGLDGLVRSALVVDADVDAARDASAAESFDAPTDLADRSRRTDD